MQLAEHPGVAGLPIYLLQAIFIIFLLPSPHVLKFKTFNNIYQYVLDQKGEIN